MNPDDFVAFCKQIAHDPNKPETISDYFARWLSSLNIHSDNIYALYIQMITGLVLHIAQCTMGMAEKDSEYDHKAATLFICVGCNMDAFDSFVDAVIVREKKDVSGG